jgi:trans-aconitate methyltransferase
MANVEWDPETYLELMVAEIPSYFDLQKEVAAATAGLVVRDMLELGVGTGETARAVRALHPNARWMGIDSSEAMLAHARNTLPNLDLRRSRLEDPLPAGPWKLRKRRFRRKLHLPGR